MARLDVFRYHPCDPQSGGLSIPVTPALTIRLGSLTDCHNPQPGVKEQFASTPLILPNRYVVVQTSRRVYCYDFSAISASNICTTPPIPPLVWRYPGDPLQEIPPTTPAPCFRSVNASPTYAVVRVGAVEEGRVFVHGAGIVVALDPATGVAVDEGITVPCDPAYSAVSVGPIEDHSGHSFVYTTAFGTTGCTPAVPRMTIFRADDMSVRFSVLINQSPGFQIGAAGAPTVHPDGHVIVASDNFRLYGVSNAPTPAPIFELRPPGLLNSVPLDDCGYSLSYSFSCTPATFPNGNAICWDELGHLTLMGPDGTLVGTRRRSQGTWVLGTGACDTKRFYNPQNIRGILVLDNATETPSDPACPRLIVRRWAHSCVFLPDNAFRGAPAVDRDGTLYCLSNGYVVALRPLVGGFNGDGCRNLFDIDALVLSLTDISTWQLLFGDKEGINLPGIGDCNNDDAFNNFDIDCLVDLLINDPTPCGDAGFTICEADPEGCGELLMAAGGGESASVTGEDGASMTATGDCTPVTDADIEHFWTMVGILHDYFGSAP